jgi:adiponectin receptor
METVNIWSHLLRSIAFVGAGMALFKIATMSTTVGVSAGDRFASAISIVGSAVCFGLSAAFHTLRSHSYNVHRFSGKLDILGICSWRSMAERQRHTTPSFATAKSNSCTGYSTLLLD